MFQSSFNSENNILYNKWIGKVKLDEVKQYFTLLNTHETLPRNLLVLQLFLDVEVDFKEGDLAEIATLLKNTIPKYESIRTAFLFNQPMPSAFGMMYKNITETFPHYSVEIFSTQEAAKKWLLNNN